MAIKEVYNPNSIEEVLSLLKKYTKDAKLIAGGTDIVVELKNGKITPDVLIDIAKISELKKIEEDNDFITIGACTTFTQVLENEYIKDNLKGLYKACKMVGSPQIRNKGTIGGNIANGAAAADSVPPLICLDSIITLQNAEGTREVSLEEYYNDLVKDDELLTHIKFKKPSKETVLTFSKLGLRKALAISRLTNSVLVELNQDGNIKHIRVASGALGKIPLREYEVEKYLLNKKINEETIEESINILKDSMEQRLKGRSTLPYKSEAIKTTLREALESATI